MRPSDKHKASGSTFLALGSNLSGPWGSPQETFIRALQDIQDADCQLLATSKVYKSASLSPGQPDYLNLVVHCRTALPLFKLLLLAKSIERRSGRRTRQHWSARTLDIDIVMAGSYRMNWPQRCAGSLTLPHPEAHKRAFVLRPLCDIAPNWYHPCLGMTAIQLLHRLPAKTRRSVQPA